MSTYRYNPERVLYVGVKSPTFRSVSPQDILLNMNRHTIVSKLRPAYYNCSEKPQDIVIQPDERSLGTDHQSNLIVLAISLMQHTQSGRIAAGHPIPDTASLIETLNSYHILSTRHPLKEIMATPSSRWKVYFCRLHENGPIFIQDCDHYEKKINTVGDLFEKEVCDKDPRFELHMTTRAELALSTAEAETPAIRLGILGQIDGVDTRNGTPLELKVICNESKFDNSVSYWCQSSLSGVNNIIKGSYTYSGRNPSTAGNRNIKTKRMSLDQFAKVQPDRKEAVYRCLYDLLTQLLSSNPEVGVVYRATGVGGIVEIDRTDATPGGKEFPLSTTELDQCAELVIGGEYSRE